MRGSSDTSRVGSEDCLEYVIGLSRGLKMLRKMGKKEPRELAPIQGTQNLCYFANFFFTSSRTHAL